MKKFFLLAALAVSTFASAQNIKVSTPKFSGYVIGQYTATGEKEKVSGDNEKENNSFNVRLIRLNVQGKINDEFEYRVQFQANGTPRVVDAYAEWQRYDYFKVKAGQFKRAFTFENPMHPIDQGFMSYSQLSDKLAGFNDRVGEQASNGRDVGVQIQGDLLKNKAGRNLLHYQVGVYNGQGINVKDNDNRKDIIGGVWVMPVKGMRIGVFGWEGSSAHKSGTEVVSLNKHRYAISGEYKSNGYEIRSEYAHSTGYAFKSNSSSDITVNEGLGNKADAFYAAGIAPVIKDKLQAKARYDLYRKSGSWDSAKTQWEVGLNWFILPSVKISAEYALVNDRSLAKHNYNMADVQFSVKF